MNTQSNNTPSRRHTIGWHTLLILVPVFLLASASEAADAREGGSLVKDFQRLNQEFNTAQQSADVLVGNTEVAKGKESLNNAHEALVQGDDAKAAEIYAGEMAAGRGPAFWEKQRAEFAAKGKEFFDLYDRLNGVIRESARTRPDGRTAVTSSILDELNRQVGSDRSNGVSNKLRSALASAKKDREKKLKALLDVDSYAAIYRADSIANLPPDVVESILVSVVEKAVEMDDAADAAHRAEIWMRSTEDNLRARAKQKAAQDPAAAQSKSARKGLFD